METFSDKSTETDQTTNEKSKRQAAETVGSDLHPPLLEALPAPIRKGEDSKSPWSGETD